ncbi:glycosyltransferase family 2 protein [Paraburkholderia bannensis]|uniref:glycosyltransferase family 2 protein n=1 Tax=Paraburkholderia bannensis TaxID=765414 RepID=UPI002ABE52F5|nr:glycosyltransferase family 2 protein [Paraburkholderia bannensis]
MAGSSGAVGTVVVFYRPDTDCVARANRLAAYGPCVVVDNSEELCDAASLGLDPRVTYLPNGANLGIATALNQGVEALIALGCTSAILFDQDSEPSESLLLELPAQLERANVAGERVAVVGPAYEDARLRGVAPFVRFQWFQFGRIEPVGDAPIDVDFLITSGSCINLTYWSAIGPMDDALFIDFVDLEWCVRAKQKGYRVLGLPWVRMRHELGGEPVRVLGRAYPMHGPLRHYYQFRNVIALVKRSSMPVKWKSAELIKLPVRVVVYCFFPNKRREHLRMVWRGVLDGLSGRLGAYRQR